MESPSPSYSHHPPLGRTGPGAASRGWQVPTQGPTVPPGDTFPGRSRPASTSALPAGAGRGTGERRGAPLHQPLTRAGRMGRSLAPGVPCGQESPRHEHSPCHPTPSSRPPPRGDTCPRAPQPRRPCGPAQVGNKGKGEVTTQARGRRSKRSPFPGLPGRGDTPLAGTSAAARPPHPLRGWASLESLGRPAPACTTGMLRRPLPRSAPRWPHRPHGAVSPTGPRDPHTGPAVTAL